MPQVAVLVTPETYPKVHHAISNPSQWNADWEKLYDECPILVHPNHLMSYARVCRQQNPNPTQRDRNDMHVFITNFQTTCEIQHRIGVKVIQRFAAGGGYDFDRRWVKASLEERRKHVLIGLANGGKQARNLNMARAYSSDVLRLDYLSNDGRTLVKLLEDITPQNMSLVPKEPYYIPSEAWDGARAAQERDPSTSEQDKFDLMEMIVLRTKLIYLVAEGIMDSFLGEPLPFVTVNKARDRRPADAKKQDLVKMKAEYTALYGEELGQVKMREDLSALEERRSRRVIHCAKCAKQQGDDERFMKCKKCWDALQRSVTYCGKPCQVADWKARHKHICGRSISSVGEAMQMSQPRSIVSDTNVSQFGPAKNGFKRTPQLINHMRYLDLHPDTDFFAYVDPAGGPRSLIIRHPLVRKVFRVARERAMVDGSKEAAAEMCHYLIWYYRAMLTDVQYGWDLNRAVDEMEKEFEYPHLRLAFKRLQDQQWADEFKRPPLVRSLPEPQWTQFIVSAIDSAMPPFFEFQPFRRMEVESVVFRNVNRNVPAIWMDDVDDPDVDEGSRADDEHNLKDSKGEDMASGSG